MYQLPKLPYRTDALEPYIDEETMKIHHGKHHAGYVEKLNKLIEGRDGLDRLSIAELLRRVNELPDEIRQGVINNGGGHANHSMFWEGMTPQPETEAMGELGKAVKMTFGGFDNFVEMFSDKAMNLFGSGWIFLMVKPDNTLAIKRHSFQNSPYLCGNVPILALDVWEHAYYLKYQNRRDEYIKAWWRVVDWRKADDNYKQAKSTLGMMAKE